MKIGANMRLTPAQLAIRLICGIDLPQCRLKYNSVQQRICAGRDLLVRISGVDFGFDLPAWHEHLKESRSGGYTYGRNISLPSMMRNALENPQWIEAVEAIRNSEKKE